MDTKVILPHLFLIFIIFFLRAATGDVIIIIILVLSDHLHVIFRDSPESLLKMHLKPPEMEIPIFRQNMVTL